MQVLHLVGVFLILGVANGFQRRNRGYSRRNGLSSWFRNEDITADQIERRCNFWRQYFVGSFDAPTVTSRGYMCIKSQASVRVLTWCREEELSPGLPPHAVAIKPTVVDSRASSLGSCDIFDVTILAVYFVIVDVINNNDIYERNSCFVRLLEGILVCVDKAEMLPEFQILTLYPIIYPPTGHPGHSIVNYIICSTSMEDNCPGPAKIISVVETDEEFRGFTCGETANSHACLY